MKKTLTQHTGSDRRAALIKSRVGATGMANGYFHHPVDTVTVLVLVLVLVVCFSLGLVSETSESQ